MRRSYRMRKEESENSKKDLKDLFTRYAYGGKVLNKEQLKDAFYHLDAPLPNKQATEALCVANNDTNNVINLDTEEFEKLVDYAYSKGFLCRA